MRSRNLNDHVANRHAWPTPTQQDSENDGGASQYERNSIPPNAATKPHGAQGQLNPDWVEWLMGWPVGWTSLEPTQMQWLSWETDPADGKTPQMIGTIRATQAVRSDEFKKGRLPSPEEYILDNPGTSGTIPRIGTGIPNRINRLKAIGNGQVPRCMATAWRLLVKKEVK